MSDAVAVTINANQAQQLENLIDEALAALRELEENGKARDARIEQSQTRTAKVMDEIQNRLATISELNAARKPFSTIFS